MSAVPSAEEMIARMDAACSEAGYPNVRFHVRGVMATGWPRVVVFEEHMTDVPAAVYWLASTIAYKEDDDTSACWACWIATIDRLDDDAAFDCANGSCSNPSGPARPPRELLRSAS